MQKIWVLTIAGLLGLLLMVMSLFTIMQGQGGLIFRLGDFVKDKTDQPRVFMPGLHVKIPFIDQLQRYDLRLQTYDVPSSRVLTKEQKALDVDYYIKWRVTDLALYFQRTNGQTLNTQRLMKQKINDAIRAEFGEHTIREVISGERSVIMETLRDKVNQSVQSLGISVIDVRIKKIELPNDVSLSVFERMRTDREKVANRHRSEGRAAQEELQAKADAEVTVILAKAKADAASIRAQGEAEAADIYNRAFERDARFFDLYRSLEAYQNSFKKGDFMVVDPNNDFFKRYLAMQRSNERHG